MVKTIKEEKSMSYRNLEIWQLANEMVLAVNEMSLNDLPDFEKYEMGSQIRRSSKSVKSNIVEGYGRRNYKKEYLHFLVISQGSLDETMDHLETLYFTKSLKDAKKYLDLKEKFDKLGRKLNLFIRAIQKR
jgi:four helix bundle protein